MIPRVISGWPNSAVSEATIRSQSEGQLAAAAQAKPETAATIGVRHSASRLQNARRRMEAAPPGRSRSRSAPMSAPAANASSEPAITMQRISGSASKPLDRGGELLHQLRRERVARLRAVQPASGDLALDAGLDQRAHCLDAGESSR